MNISSEIGTSRPSPYHGSKLTYLLINGQYKQRNIHQQNNILFVHKKDIAFLIRSSKIILIADTYPKNYTVRRVGLILRSIEWMLKMQFSMARKFTLQPLRRYDVKPPEKTAQT